MQRGVGFEGAEPAGTVLGAAAAAVAAMMGVPVGSVTDAGELGSTTLAGRRKKEQREWVEWAWI